LLAGGEILSGGNFHGQALAMAFDFAAIALAVLGGISERRTFQLICGVELPPFLADNPGLESGFMIPQVAAAALASRHIVLILTAHAGHDWPAIVAGSPLVIDTRNATAGLASPTILRL
jgi:histidine ammonia-lyase